MRQNISRGFAIAALVCGVASLSLSLITLLQRLAFVNWDKALVMLVVAIIAGIPGVIFGIFAFRRGLTDSINFALSATGITLSGLGAGLGGLIYLVAIGF